MIDASLSAGRDPRLAISRDDLDLASVRSAPEVGRAPNAAEALGLAAGLIGATALGGITILSLAHHHTAAPAKPPPPAVVQAAVPPSVARPAVMAASVVPPSLATPPVAAVAPASVLVLDNSTPTPTPVAAIGSRSEQAAPPAKTNVFFSQDEQFAARAGDEPVPVSHAHRLEHPGSVITQGVVIPAVLETALNSDLPGYARALVSGDVRSFDGSRVLIPRGSRLVGQYKSALQTGQSRMLIIWNRLLRPDGVSIQLASPVTDDLGVAGLSGKVDTHFLQRFGSAILLSVIGGLANAGGSSNTIVVGTATQGSSTASVALQNDVKISPTVRVMQGAPIQVFVARDLDFSEGAS